MMLIFISNLIWLAFSCNSGRYYKRVFLFIKIVCRSISFRGVKRKNLATNIESTEPFVSSVVCIEHCFCAAVFKRMPTLRERINKPGSRLGHHLYSEPRRSKKTERRLTIRRLKTRRWRGGTVGLISPIKWNLTSFTWGKRFQHLDYLQNFERKTWQRNQAHNSVLLGQQARHRGFRRDRSSASYQSSVSVNADFCVIYA